MCAQLPTPTPFAASTMRWRESKARRGNLTVTILDALPVGLTV